MPPKSKTSRYFSVILIGLVAAAILSLAWPRLQASYRYLPVEFAIEKYYASREIPSDRLVVLIEFTQQAIGYHDHFRFHDGLSLLQLLRAMDFNTPALERRPAYKTSAFEAEESLRRAPAQPSVWLRLASLRWILHDEPETIRSAWKMSIFTGRTDSSLISQRVEIGLVYRYGMDAESVAMLRDQLLLGWRLQPGSLIKALARRDPNLYITRNLISKTDPAALDEMEAWLAKLR